MKYAKISGGIVEQVQPYHEEGFVEVPDDVVCGMLDNGDGTFSIPKQPTATVKSSAKSSIDAAAGQARARYITTVPGQEATYMLKERQARDYAAAGYPAASVPSLVQAEADAFGITPQQAADEIIAQADAWITLAAKIEYARRSGKAEVDAASDAASVETIKNKIIAQLDAI